METIAMHHPDLPGQTITVSEWAVPLLTEAGWLDGPSEDTPPPPVVEEPAPVVELHHPDLPDATITVAPDGVPLFEQAGWEQGPASTDTPADDAPADTTTSEAASTPGSDGGQPATTDTGTTPGSGTEEEEGTA